MGHRGPPRFAEGDSSSWPLSAPHRYFARRQYCTSFPLIPSCPPCMSPTISPIRTRILVRPDPRAPHQHADHEWYQRPGRQPLADRTGSERPPDRRRLSTRSGHPTSGLRRTSKHIQYPCTMRAVSFCNGSYIAPIAIFVDPALLGWLGRAPIPRKLQAKNCSLRDRLHTTLGVMHRLLTSG